MIFNNFPKFGKNEFGITKVQLCQILFSRLPPLYLRSERHEHEEWTKWNFFFVVIPLRHHDHVLFDRYPADRFQAETVAVNGLTLGFV